MSLTRNPGTVQHTETPTSTAPSSRWRSFRWIAPVGLAAVAGVVAVGAVRGDPETPAVTTQRPAYHIVQDEIDAALAANTTGSLVAQRPAYQIVQDEIDAALAANTTGSLVAQQPAYEIIQDEIDRALADRGR